MKLGMCPSIITARLQSLVAEKLVIKTVFMFFVLLSVCGQAWSEEALFFQAVNPDQLEKTLISSTVVKRIRPVLPDVNELINIDQGELVLNLFDNVSVSVTISRQDRSLLGQTLWQGTVTGVAHSYVLLVSDGKTISGEVGGADFHFQIRPWEDDVHIVREMIKEQSLNPVIKASGDTALEAEVIVLTNQERVANSLPPLSYDAQLTTSARGHAMDMATNNYYDHNSQDGRTVFDRIKATGYVYNSAGENIAAGYTSASLVVAAWMNSPGHRENILRTTFCDIGVGYAYDAVSDHGYHYWVQNFARKTGVTVCSATSFPPPAVASLSASNIQASGATLNGSVNPNGLATNYLFQYGLSASYGQVTTTTNAGSGITAVAVSATISGLNASTVYHYRLVASNATGTSYGSDKTLTTNTSTGSTSSIPIGVLSLILSDSNIGFSEKFDQDPSGWTKNSGGLWQWGVPNCGGATSGYTGANSYSYNLTGNYENNLGIQYLQTPLINCKGLTNVHLRFWRWLEVERSQYDRASIFVSNDGVSWSQVWTNSFDTIHLDGKWVEVEYDISALADKQSTVYIRWNMGPTDSLATFCGWNIDDVEVFSKQ